MYKLLIAAGFVALAAPLAAQPVRDDDRVERSLPSRYETEQMGRVLADIVDAVMDVRVGPIVEAADPGRRLGRREREQTLGDLAARGDPYFEQRLHRDISRAAARAGDASARAAAVAPALRRALAELERNLERAAGGLPAHGRVYRERDDNRELDRRVDPRDDEYRDDRGDEDDGDDPQSND